MCKEINFRHTLTTAFQCYCCHRDYQCNKNDRVDKKERQWHEAEFNTTGKHNDEFYSALLLIFSRIKNKPTSILQPENIERTNDTLTTKCTKTISTTTIPTTTEPDFDFSKRPKELLTPEESTTNSTTTIPPSTTSTSSTKITSTRTTSESLEPISDSDISCQICKIELKQTEIEQHLKEHLKNPLLKDFIYNKLQMKKHLTEFDNIKAIFYKLTDVKIREMIETIQKYIEKYGEQTNNKAEIYAAIRAIESCKDKINPLNIMTD
ncbi:20286_t:CDS:2, partial [Gigaspora rosea]